MEILVLRVSEVSRRPGVLLSSKVGLVARDFFDDL
jgi:hypothetical protein